MRRIAIPAVVSLLLAVPGLVGIAAPAQAYSVPTFSEVDVSVPGRAHVTVTTDAPYVVVWLRSEQEQVGGSTYNISIGPAVVQSTTDGQSTFGVDTWGIDTGRFIARTCTDASVSSCTGEVTAAASTFSPGDPGFEVTWPDDSGIGAGESYSVTATDPDGGGHLFARWVIGSYEVENTPLVRGEATLLPLAYEGAGPILIQRCSPFDQRVCHTVDQRAVKVNRWADAGVRYEWLGELNPALGTKLKPVITTYEGQNFTLDWHVEDADTSEPIAGASGTLTGLAADAGGVIRPVIDPSAVIGDKTYVLRMTLSYVDPDVGTVSRDLVARFRIDSMVAPITSISVSSPRLYPYRDEFRDFVDISVTHPYEMGNMRVEVLDANNNLVAALIAYPSIDNDLLTWTGKSRAGGFAPAGVYHFRAIFTDPVGNVSTRTQGSVTVVRKKVMSRYFKRTYSASGSMVKKVAVGGCSTLASPSKRGWAGSLGFYSNNKCSRTVNASFLETRHAVRVPRALWYDGLQISAYGGAAREAARSVAYIAYINNAGKFTEPTMLMPWVGLHSPNEVWGAKFIFPDRYVAWDVFNGKGSRYDVKSFTVQLEYRVLVPE